jgi:hypothetical protein
MPTALPTLPASTLAVRPWPDPVIDQVGHDPRSPYVEQFWLGVLGPTRMPKRQLTGPPGARRSARTPLGKLGVGLRPVGRQMSSSRRHRALASHGRLLKSLHGVVFRDPQVVDLFAEWFDLLVWDAHADSIET